MPVSARLFLAVCVLAACGGDPEPVPTGADAHSGADAAVLTDLGGDTGDAPRDEPPALGDAITDTETSTDTSTDTADASDAAHTETDQGPAFDYPCKPLATEACVTACISVGKRKCLKDWGPCVPPAEFCGNCTDDDCDGLINEDCPPNPDCQPTPPPACPTAVITLAEAVSVDVGTTLHLDSAKSTVAAGKTLGKVQWAVNAPDGSAAKFITSPTVGAPTLVCDVAGQYLISLTVWDSDGTVSCTAAQLVVDAKPSPPQTPEVGCADGQREGFLDVATYPQIAACAGAWQQPGITPDGLVPTCSRQAGDDGAKKDGTGCGTPDLCATGWHVCSTWQEVAKRSPTGCAGATPPDAKSKSLFFAARQPSKNGSVCGQWGDGVNDVFGCGNLGTGLGPDKKCGPLDRVLASTQADKCGFNEAEPPLGPWECKGGPGSDLEEGEHVTKKGCAKAGCSYDGVPLSSWDKGGVLCCRD